MTVEFQVPLWISESKFLDIIQVGSTYPHYIFIIHDDIVARGMFEDFFNAVDIDDGRSMQSDEELGVEFLLHLTDTIITQEISTGGD